MSIFTKKEPPVETTKLRSYQQILSGIQAAETINRDRAEELKELKELIRAIQNMDGLIEIMSMGSSERHRHFLIGSSDSEFRHLRDVPNIKNVLDCLSAERKQKIYDTIENVIHDEIMSRHEDGGQ